MVALNPDYAPAKSASRSENRVGDFFVWGGDRVGVESSASRIAIGKKYDGSSTMASGHSKFASGTAGNAMGNQPWSSWQMYRHYQRDGGDVTLQEMGLYEEVKSSSVVEGVEGRFGQQIEAHAESEAARLGAGTHPISETFSNTYDFGSVRWAFGGAFLSGDFSFSGSSSFSWVTPPPPNPSASSARGASMWRGGDGPVPVIIDNLVLTRRVEIRPVAASGDGYLLGPNVVAGYGGAFASGAATVAMVHLFNHEGGLLGSDKPSEYADGFQQFGDSLSDAEMRSLMIDTIPDATDSAFIAALDGASQGGLAYTDGLNPFGDPFSAFYDTNDFTLQTIRYGGAFAREGLITVSGGAFARSIFYSSGLTAARRYKSFNFITRSAVNRLTFSKAFTASGTLGNVQSSGSLIFQGASAYDTFNQTFDYLDAARNRFGN